MKLFLGLIIGFCFGVAGGATYVWWQFAKSYRDNF